MDSLHKNWSLVRYRNLHCLLHLDTLDYALEKNQFIAHRIVLYVVEKCICVCTLDRSLYAFVIIYFQLLLLQHRYISPELIRKVNTTNNKTLIFIFTCALNPREYCIDLNFGRAKLWRIDSNSPNLTLQFTGCRFAKV